MKLILSSCDFSNEASANFIKEHLQVPLEECRVLFFPNEKGLEMSIRKSKYVKRLEGYGFDRSKVYVFDYSCPQAFENLEIDAVYISGGNTFGTLKRIRDAGFEDKIREYVKDGVVYIGGSAGAHIACGDISHVEKYDENKVGLTPLVGLGLYRGRIVCHFTEERREHFEMLKREGRRNVISLTDSQSVCIEL